MSLNLRLPIPLSVNGLYRTWRGRMLLSKRGRSWADVAIPLIRQQAHGMYFNGRIAVVYRYAFKTDRKCDIFNYEKILSDCITKAGVWKDDSQIDDGRVIRLPVSKSDPHCTVSIEAL